MRRRPSVEASCTPLFGSFERARCDAGRAEDGARHRRAAAPRRRRSRCFQRDRLSGRAGRSIRRTSRDSSGRSSAPRGSNSTGSPEGSRRRQSCAAAREARRQRRKARRGATRATERRRPRPRRSRRLRQACKRRRLGGASGDGRRRGLCRPSVSQCYTRPSMDDGAHALAEHRALHTRRCVRSQGKASPQTTARVLHR